MAWHGWVWHDTLLKDTARHVASLINGFRVVGADLCVLCMLAITDLGGISLLSGGGVELAVQLVDCAAEGGHITVSFGSCGVEFFDVTLAGLDFKAEFAAFTGPPLRKNRPTLIDLIEQLYFSGKLENSSNGA